MNESKVYSTEILNSQIKLNEKYHYHYQYYKVLYIVITAIISFLGLLILIEYGNNNSSKDNEYLNSKSNSNSNNLQEFYFFYIFSFSFSWIFVLLISMLIVIIIKCNERNNNAKNNNPNINNSKQDQDNILSDFYSSNLKAQLDKNKAKDKENNDNKNLKNLYGHEIKNDNKIKLNLNINDLKSQTEKQTEKELEREQEQEKIGTFLHLQFFFDNEKFHIIFFSLSLLVYFITAIIGIILCYELIEKKIFKNYKIYYKIYLFIFLSTTKSLIFICCFFYKIFYEKNKLNTEENINLNEEYLNQIELEIKNAKRMSAIISPNGNIRRFNSKISRQDFFDFSQRNSIRLNDDPFDSTRKKSNVNVCDKKYFNSEFNLENIEANNKVNFENFHSINNKIIKEEAKEKETIPQTFSAFEDFNVPIYNDRLNKNKLLDEDY